MSHTSGLNEVPCCSWKRYSRSCISSHRRWARRLRRVSPAVKWASSCATTPASASCVNAAIASPPGTSTRVPSRSS